MPSLVPPSALEWLRSDAHDPVLGSWVPGADSSELRALNGLGAVARELTRPNGWEPRDPTIKRWFDEGPAVPPQVVADIKVAVNSDRDAALAALYSELVRSEHRRQLGTFFTPSQEAEFMIQRWHQNHGAPRAVVDVGAGVGVFTAAAMNVWPDAHVTAIDVNPVTLGLLGARLYGSDDATAVAAHSDLVLDDFTTWIGSEHYKELPPSRLVLGNPPYTRASLMSTDERKRLHEATRGVCGLRASLSTLITALTVQNLADEDGLCLLLPAQWLESDYAEGLREVIWALPRRVELRLVESGLFDDAQVDAVILMIGPASLELPRPDFFVASWRETDVSRLDRAIPCPSNWRKLFSQETDTSGPDPTPNDETLAHFAAVRRGIATGANSFFVLTDTERLAAQLDEIDLIPAVTRLLSLPELLYKKNWARSTKGARRWLVTATKDKRHGSAPLNAYLSSGEAKEIDKRHLCEKRGTWHDLSLDVTRPDIIIGSMTRGSFKLIENRMKAVITNNLYGWTWKASVSATDRARIIRWFRSEDGQRALQSAARNQGDGLLKLEPRALKELRIPQFGDGPLDRRGNPRE